MMYRDELQLFEVSVYHISVSISQWSFLSMADVLLSMASNELNLTKWCSKRKSGSRKECEAAGFFIFLHIWMLGYFRLGSVSSGLMIAQQG